MTLVFDGSGNPGKEKAKEVVASEFKAKPELVVLNGVKSNFGTNVFVIDALVYDSEEDLRGIEPRKKEKK